MCGRPELRRGVDAAAEAGDGAAAAVGASADHLHLIELCAAPWKRAPQSSAARRAVHSFSVANLRGKLAGCRLPQTVTTGWPTVVEAAYPSSGGAPPSAVGGAAKATMM
jgi:hypothetical protein